MLKDSKDFKVPLELKVLLVLKVPLELKGLLVLRVQQVLKDLKDSKVAVEILSGRKKLMDLTLVYHQHQMLLASIPQISATM